MSTWGLGGLARWRERDVIALLYAHGWKDADKLLQMACTVDAESGCYPNAWHWNSPAEGGNGSVDWGMFQLNDNNAGGSAPKLDANNNPIPTTKFQKDALVPATAAITAREMYNERGFQPWYGYANWKKYAGPMTRALCNWLREKYSITPLI